MSNIRDQDRSLHKAFEVAKSAPNEPLERLTDAMNHRFEKRGEAQKQDIRDTVESVAQFTDPRYDIRQTPDVATSVGNAIRPTIEVGRERIQRGLLSPESFPISKSSTEAKKARTVLPAVNAVAMLGKEGLNSAHHTLQKISQYSTMGDVLTAAKRQAQKLNLSQEERHTLSIINESSQPHINAVNFDKSLTAMLGKMNTIYENRIHLSPKTMEIVSTYLLHACSQSQQTLDKIALAPNLRYALSFTETTKPFHWLWADSDHPEQAPLKKSSVNVAAQAAAHMLINYNPNARNIIHISKDGWKVRELKMGESRLLIGQPPPESAKSDKSKDGGLTHSASKQQQWLILAFIETHIDGDQLTNQYRSIAIAALKRQGIS